MIYTDTIALSTKKVSRMSSTSQTGVAGIVASSDIKNGLVTVFCTGSTGTITTIEFESGVMI